MKRWIALLLAMLMVLSLAACGSKNTTTISQIPGNNQGTDKAEGPGVPGQENAEEKNEPETESEAVFPKVEPAPASSYVLDNQVVVDNEYCNVTAVKVTEPDSYDIGIKFLCENKTSDKNLTFSSSTASVNGYMVSPFMYENVSAGKKLNTELDFDLETLERCGIKTLDQVRFELRVYNADDWMEDEYVNEYFTLYPTGLTADQIVVPERKTVPGEVVVYEDEECRFVILNADPDDYWGYGLNCYLENKGDKNLMFSWNNVSVNGFMIDPYWALFVTAGDRAFSTISFMESNLKENDISTVEEIEFELSIYDYDDWYTGYSVRNTFTFVP